MSKSRLALTAIIIVLLGMLITVSISSVQNGALSRLNPSQMQAVNMCRHIADAMDDFHDKYAAYWHWPDSVTADSANRFAFSERGISVAAGDPYRYTLKFASDSEYTVRAERFPVSGDSTSEIFTYDANGTWMHSPAGTIQIR